MKLDHNCIRAILLEVERFGDPETGYFYDPDNLPDDSFLTSFDPVSVDYHIRQCDMSDLLYNVQYQFDHPFIEDLTPEGHAFVSDVRDSSTWNKLFSKLKDASLPAVIDIARTTALDALKSLLGL